MYYTVIKHSSHLRTLEKCRKHSPAARAFYISLVFSNACRVLSQCNTRLRLLYLLNISDHICKYYARRQLKDRPSSDNPILPPPPPPPNLASRLYLDAKSTQNQQQYSQYQDYLALETRRLAKRRCQ